MAEQISADEAARRLGVKRETLYAYVSRGTLHRQRSSSGRQSLFDADEVALLAGRGTPRRRAGELPVVVESAITSIETSGHLAYRGVDVATLVAGSSFEEVAELLWTGLPAVGQRFDIPATVTAALHDVLTVLPQQSSPVERIRIALSVAALLDHPLYDRSPEGLATVGRRIIAVEVLAAGRRQGHKSAGSIAEQLWLALTGSPGSDSQVQALDAALVVLADHGLASSTLTARVAASAWADPYLVVSAGLATGGGPLEGSGADRVAEMLRRAAAAGSAASIAASAERGEAVPGFGSPVYRARDPHAETLWPLVETAGAGGQLVELAARAAEAVSVTYRNVDYVLGTLVASAGMPFGSGEAILAVARSAGWLAHAGEEYGHGLRYEARTAYTGPQPPVADTPSRAPRHAEQSAATRRRGADEAPSG